MKINKDEICISKVQPEDAQAILDYTRIIGGESHNLTFGSEGLPVTIEMEQNFIQSVLDHPINQMWKTMVHGELAALCDLNVYPRKRMKHRCELSISVQKKYWHLGIGRMCMDRMITYAKEQESLKIITIEVIEDNERAIALYTSYGFVNVGYLQKYFNIEGTYYGAYLMELELTKKEEQV